MVRWKGEVMENMGNATIFLTQDSVADLLVKNAGLLEMLAVMSFLCTCACCLAPVHLRMFSAIPFLHQQYLSQKRHHRSHLTLHNVRVSASQQDLPASVGKLVSHAKLSEIMVGSCVIVCNADIAPLHLRMSSFLTAFVLPRQHRNEQRNMHRNMTL